MLYGATKPKQELVDGIVQGYNSLSYPGQQQLVLERISSAWVDSASEMALRRYALEMLDQMGSEAAAMALGNSYLMENEVERMRRAAACLAILDHDSSMRDMVNRLMRGYILWAIREEQAEEYVLQPLLDRLPLVHLHGLQRLIG